MQTRQKKCMCVQQSRKLVPREHINKCFCFLMKISRSARLQFHPQPSSVLNELGDKEERKEGTDAVTSFGLSSSIYIQPKSCSFLGGSTCVFFYLWRRMRCDRLMVKQIISFRKPLSFKLQCTQLRRQKGYIQ